MEPEKLKYLPSHEWVAVDGDLATIGISKFAVEQLTDLLQVELPKRGNQVTPGKSFGEIESVKSVSDLYSPVGGEVVDVNDDVLGNLQLLADDPYGNGWLIKVRMAQPSADLGDLLDYSAYEKQLHDSPHD
ncbi:MAG: glycine cleavage system protein GcvH [Isosphaeraceae bacterium]